jgi:hypothetical protein
VTQSRPSILDRREVVALSGAATLVLFAPAWIKSVASVAPARPAASMIALADPRYGESLIFARSLQREGTKVLALASDRARLWSDAIEPRLPGGLQYLTGLTLESDLFAFERLAENSSARTWYVGLHDWRCRQQLAHRLSGSITLDPIAEALVSGNDRWAGKLGEALALAKKDHCEEGRLALDCAAPAAQGPRFFVSWLMRWTAQP